METSANAARNQRFGVRALGSDRELVEHHCLPSSRLAPLNWVFPSATTASIHPHQCFATNRTIPSHGALSAPAGGEAQLAIR